MKTSTTRITGKISPYVIWALIFLISLSLRYWYSSTEFCFYTDQSRDAIVANKILQGDLQLFGPVVNGRGAVFHGVLYYYVIAPLYAIGGGNPLFVSAALSLISTLGLIPTYFLAKKFLKSEVLAFLVLSLMAFSLSSVETSASFWNLQLSIILLPVYCLFLLKTYNNLTWSNSLFTGIFLGLLIQSGFSNIQWMLPFCVTFGLLFFKHKNRRHFLTNVAVSLLGLTLATSSMILVEILAWKRGLFTMEDSLHWVSTAGFSFEGLQSAIAWYFKSLTNFFIPNYSLATFVLILISTFTILKTKTDKRWRWLGLLLVPPILAQLASNSAASYILTGYESIFYIGIVLVFQQALESLNKNIEKNKQIAIVLIALIIFVVANIAGLHQAKNSNRTLACVWPVTAFEELEAVDYTYQLANQEPFSIDVVAEPYGINMKYGYLYSWYGQKEYGYTPQFTGGSQIGYITEGLLQESQDYLPKHFIIYEPGSYNYWFSIRTGQSKATRESQSLFYYRQPPISKLQETQRFGEHIVVDYYLSEGAE